MALPGVRTVLKDRFYILSRVDIPTGPRLAILGRRATVNNTSDGDIGVPSFDPYLATNEQKVVNAFGSGSELHRAYVEAVAGGATQIYLVALPMAVTDTDLAATTTAYHDSDAGGAIATGINVLDEAMLAAETILPDIIVPWGRGGHPAEWGEVAATPVTDPPRGFYANNSASPTTSMAKRVADWAETITDRSHPCFAVLGMKSFAAVDQVVAINESMTASELAGHLTAANLISRDVGTTLTSGHFLSIVQSELKPLGYDTTWGYSNGAVMYAGFLCQLKSWSSATGKIVFNLNGLRYNPSRTQQSTLIDKGLVPVALDFQRRATWIDATTFSKTGSDYARLSTLRIVFDALQMIRQISESYIGEAATLQHRNAFETAITAGLRGMQQQGALLESNFVVTYVPSANKALVDLSLTPAFELRNIEVSVAVQLG